MIPLAWPSRQTLLVSGVLVLAVAAVATGVWYWQAGQQQRADTAYAAAFAQLGPARAPQAPPEARANAIRALEAALQQYPAAATAGLAAYELGGLRASAGQNDAARSAYEIALNRGTSATLKTLARAGIAYTWEAEGNFAKAAGTYQAAASGLRPADFFYEQLLFDLARVQELAGRKDDAVQTYRRILNDVTRTARGEEVRTRLASLGAAP